MLVLSRKLREQIQIGENVTITILRVKGNSVRIGIEAPRDVKVVRGELPASETTSVPVGQLEVTLDQQESSQSESRRRNESRRGEGAVQESAPHRRGANVSVFVSDPSSNDVVEVDASPLMKRLQERGLRGSDESSNGKVRDAQAHRRASDAEFSRLSMSEKDARRKSINPVTESGRQQSSKGNPTSKQAGRNSYRESRSRISGEASRTMTEANSDRLKQIVREVANFS